MKIVGIHAENFKSFEKLDMEGIGDFNLIIGKNNSGKSNILSLLEYIFNRPQLSQINKIYYNEDTKNKIIVRLEVILTDKEKEYCFPKQKIYRNELMLFTGEDIIKLLKKPLLIELDLIKCLTERKIIIGNILSNLKDLSNNKQNMAIGLEKIRIEEIINQYTVLRIPAVRNIPKHNSSHYSNSPQTTFHPDGREMSIVIHNHLNYTSLNRNCIKDLTKEIVKLFPELRGIRIDTSDIGNNETEIHIEQDDTFLPISNYGTGVMDIIIFLLNIQLNIKDNSMIEIEEPENNLHPELQKKLMNYLQTYANSKNTQFFITTHSPVLIDSLENSEVFLITKDKSSKIINIHNNATMAFDELGLKLSDMLQSNLIVYVEGPSEKNMLVEYIKKYDSDILRKSFTIQPLGGIENIRRMNFEDLKKINRKFILILDSDKKSETESINRIRKEIKEKVELTNNTCYIDTEVRELENYFTNEAIKKYYINKDNKEFNIKLGKFDKFSEKLHNSANLPNNQNINYDKLRDAHNIVKLMVKEDIPPFIEEIIKDIAKKSA